jgi:hypothetical protein
MPQIADVLEGKGYQFSVRACHVETELGQHHNLQELLKHLHVYLLTLGRSSI